MRNYPLKYLARIATGIVAFLIITCLLAGCGGKDSIQPAKIVVVMDIGGIEDRGKNAMIWRGCNDVLVNAPVNIEVQEPGNLAEGVETLKKVATEDYDMVIVAASPLIQTTIELAEKHPETDFLLIDSEEGADNVKAISFPHYEAGYLMGVLAAETTKTGKIGFLGARDDNVSNLILDGYRDGAVSINPSIITLGVFIGTDYEAAADTEKARETALALIGKGVDGIFVTAGFSTEVVIETAEEEGTWAIAYESNLNTMGGGAVIASLIRHLDVVVSKTVLAAAQGEFEGGVERYAIDDSIIEYILNEEHALVDAERLTPILEAAETGLLDRDDQR
jgi:basic membrane protein A